MRGENLCRYLRKLQFQTFILETITAKFNLWKLIVGVIWLFTKSIFYLNHNSIFAKYSLIKLFLCFEISFLQLSKFLSENVSNCGRVI